MPPFDFAVPGVTSMSADTHKYGYAAKGTSVVLYRGAELRHAQYFAITDWPGGLYCSPTFAGSRPGALSAACWAAMVSIGEEGYVEATGRILRAADTIKAGIAAIDGVDVIADPLFCVAVRAPRRLDIYRVADAMTARGWSLNGLQLPPAVHICVTQRHTRRGGRRAVRGRPGRRRLRRARRARRGRRDGAHLRRCGYPARVGGHRNAPGLHGSLVRGLTRPLPLLSR